MARTAALGLCVFIAAIVVNASATPDEFYNRNLPSGIALGMSLDAVTQVRPEARKTDATQDRDATSDESATMVEVARQGKVGTAYWYRFKNGKLGAVSRSISTKNLPAESAESDAGRVYNELRESFELLRQEEILRSTGAATFLLAAQLWEDKENGLNVYFVASSQENTIIIFDPNDFGAKDFFVPFDKRQEIDAQAKSVRDMLGESMPTPAPIIDLLPQVIKESASNRAATTPAPPGMPLQTAMPHSTPAQKPQQEASPTPTVAVETKPAPDFPIIPVAIIATLIVAAAMFFLRRKKP